MQCDELSEGTKKKVQNLNKEQHFCRRDREVMDEISSSVAANGDFIRNSRNRKRHLAFKIRDARTRPILAVGRTSSFLPPGAEFPHHGQRLAINLVINGKKECSDEAGVSPC